MKLQSYDQAPRDGTRLFVCEGDNLAEVAFHRWSDEELKDLPDNQKQNEGYWHYCDENLNDICPQGPETPFSWIPRPEIDDKEPAAAASAGEAVFSRMFENDIRFDGIFWLAGAAHGFAEDDVFDAIISAAEHPYWAHDSMAVFSAMPDRFSEHDEFAEWIARERIFGFLVKVSTPRPVSFSDDGCATHYGFGYTAFTWLYVEDLNDAMPMAISWREELYKQMQSQTSQPSPSP